MLKTGTAPPGRNRRRTSPAGTWMEPDRRRARPASAFSLLELLVVLTIIGLMAALGLPALKGIGASNAISTANRQLLDDLAYARMKAISGRTTVYMVFVPPNPFSHLAKLTLDPQRRQMSNLFGGQFISYALLAKRSVGDQPGRANARYLTDWKRLPEGVFFATNKFVSMSLAALNKITDPLARPLARMSLPFPTAKSPTLELPYVAFNPQGQLESVGRDEVIPLARGSIFYPQNALGAYAPVPADVREVPPGNSTNTYNLVYVNWLTGRARVLKREIQ